MKKIGYIGMALFISLFVFGNMQSFASTGKTYKTMQEFEAAEGAICAGATDGCNSYFMTEDGKVGGGTLMYCEQEQVWSCTQYKDVTNTPPVSGAPEQDETFGLSNEEKVLFNSIVVQLEEKYEQKARSIMTKVYALESKFGKERMQRFLDLLAKRIDEKIKILNEVDVNNYDQVENTILILQFLGLKVKVYQHILDSYVY